VTFEITPHPNARMFEGTDKETILKQLIQEMQNLQTTENLREGLRQAGFVSLFFFEKFIAGYNGPFDKLNYGLHLDMANFYQKYALVPGCRVACFEPRFHYKSSVFTTGGNGWDLLRDPNETIGLYHAKYDEALDFLHITQRVFDSNEFFRWLYPEYVPERGQKEWNDNEMRLPPTVKTRHTKECSLECGSVGGTSQGRHYTKICMDDIVGEQDLDAGRASSIEMLKKTNWISDAERALVMTATSTRIVLAATRYAEDDAYSQVSDNMGKLIAYDDEKALDYQVVPNGKWTVYWRFVEENGKIIFPEAVTKEYLEDTRKNNPWFYWTQLENRPKRSGLNELISYKVHDCKLIYDDDKGYLITYGERQVQPLDECDVIQAEDPAATETGVSAKTSRTAVVLVAHAPDNKRFIIEIRAGFVGTSEGFSWLFDNVRKYKDYLRATIFEAQGPFKALIGPLREMESREECYLSLDPQPAEGKKDIRIRNALQPLVSANLLYIDETIRSKFDDEYRRFAPGAKAHIDILDACALALSNTIRPLSEEERLKKTVLRERRKLAYTTNVAGY